MILKTFITHFLSKATFTDVWDAISFPFSTCRRDKSRMLRITSVLKYEDAGLLNFFSDIFFANREIGFISVFTLRKFMIWNKWQARVAICISWRWHRTEPIGTIHNIHVACALKPSILGKCLSSLSMLE